MSKIFRSDIEASFFKYLSRIWDRLPQDDRDLLVEYWRGLLRASADEYGHYLQVEAANSIVTINPYEVRKWRSINIFRTPSFLNLEDDGLKEFYPTDRPHPYHAEEGVLRFEHLYKSGQSLTHEYKPAITNPSAFLFELDLNLFLLDSADEFLVGFSDGVEGRLGSGVFLSFGRLASLNDNASYYESTSERTVGEFLLPESTPVYQGTLTVTGEHTLHAAGFNFSSLDVRSYVYAVMVTGSTLGNNGIYRIVGIKRTATNSDTLVVAESLTAEPGLSFKVYLAKEGGILSRGYSSGNSAINGLIPVNDLAGLSFIGGQVGIRVAGGVFTSVHLYFSSLTSPDSVPTFNVYTAENNYSGTYKLLNTSGPISPVNLGGGLYELRFSDVGYEFADKSWIKIRPTNPGTTYTLDASVVDPVRLVLSTTRLRRDWMTSTTLSDPSLKVVLTGRRGIYDSVQMFNVPVTSLSGKHRYRLIVTDGLLKVYVDGAEALSLEYNNTDTRTFAKFGLHSLRGGKGIRGFVQNLRFTEFNIPTDIAEIPALYDRYENQTIVLESGKDYTIEPSGVLRFHSLTPNGSDLTAYDYLVAEYVSYARRRIQGNYGVLVGVSGVDSPALKNKVMAIWNALQDGPLLESIRKGVLALLGAPITTLDGFVTSETPAEDHIYVDGVKFSFPADVGTAVNPRTGLVYKKGDYVPAYSSLSGGVTVRDHIVQMDWWYPHLLSGELHELQKYHMFEVEIDEKLVTSVNLSDIHSFLNRIKSLGESYLLVSRSDVVDTVVVESNLDRTGLLNSDSSLVFIGDSSDPAVACAPFVKSELVSNTFGNGMFGSIDLATAQSLLESSTIGPYLAYDSLNDGGYGDPTEAFVEKYVLASGTGGIIDEKTFRDLSANFVDNAVFPGDLLFIPDLGFFVVSDVGTTDLIVHTTEGTLGLATVGLNYEVIRLSESNRIPTPSLLIGGYSIREGGYVVVRADDLDEALVVVGINPNRVNGSYGLVQPEELVDAFYFENGDPRVPGLIAYVDTLRTDPRDYSFFEYQPRRLCLRTVSTKGHNSKLTFTASDGLTDLRISSGTYRGFITFPGQNEISSYSEPPILPYSESEREAAQHYSNPPDPGLSREMELYANDGLAIRRDVKAVLADGVIQYRFRDIDYDDPGVGQPYQYPFANSAQFGTFYSDYVYPGNDYKLPISGAYPIETSRIRLPIPSSGVVVATSFTGEFLGPDTIWDPNADFWQIRKGDDVQIVVGPTTYRYRIRTVVSGTVLKLSIVQGSVLPGNVLRTEGLRWTEDLNALVGDAVRVGTYGSRTIISINGIEATVDGENLPVGSPVSFTVGGGNTLSPGPVTYSLVFTPDVGDYLYIDSFSPVDVSFDRSAFPLFEGDVLRIGVVEPTTSYTDVVVERISATGARTVISFPATASTFSIEGFISRSPESFSLNPNILSQRTHRVNKGHRLLSDETGGVEDSVEIEVLSAGSATTFEYGGYSVAIDVGEKFVEIDTYSGSVLYTIDPDGTMGTTGTPVSTAE